MSLSFGVQVNVERSVSYLSITFTLGETAIVSKYHVFGLQIYAVCINFILGVSRLYFASKVYN